VFTRFVIPESGLFSEVRRLEQELDELLGGVNSWSSSIRSLPPGTFPAINVGSTDDQVTVYVFAPGIDPKTLDIQMQQNLLSISGRREESSESGATFYRHFCLFDGSDSNPNPMCYARSVCAAPGPT